MRPSQDRLREFLLSHPGATRDQVEVYLSLSYCSVVGLCQRGIDAGWLRSELTEGKNGRRSVWRYWVRQ
jgi:hypothetical protein